MDDPSDANVKSRSRDAAARARYDEDLYSWAAEQAELLRAGRINKIDAKNIAEELDDVGSEQYDKLESALRLILSHLLKWDHQPERRSRSWRATIVVQRNHATKVLTRNPGLRPIINEALHAAYRDARIEASAETHIDEASFPLECPYSWGEIMERPVSWPPEA